MSLKEVLEWCGENFWSLILGLSVFIQITPIKLNPWTTLFKWIGKMINGELTLRFEDMEKKVTNLIKQRQEDEKDRIRWEILDFANSCRNGRKHAKDEYQHIIDLNDKYKKLLIETNDKNGVFEAEYDYIKALYKEHQEKNDFL